VGGDIPQQLAQVLQPVGQRRAARGVGEVATREGDRGRGERKLSRLQEHRRVQVLRIERRGRSGRAGVGRLARIHRFRGKARPGKRPGDVVDRRPGDRLSRGEERRGNLPVRRAVRDAQRGEKVARIARRERGRRRRAFVRWDEAQLDAIGREIAHLEPDLVAGRQAGAGLGQDRLPANAQPGHVGGDLQDPRPHHVAQTQAGED
jgi:hypothetical protein